ncbi:hypothetical protein BTJ40_15735 [Microbulbifer sp. A4B17]|uniref:hypothetical protein n=1 Tax=Microbulbifer sp. A4B17 TaxID=359370 RepID=UPI000D52DE11|nr:hypothetical protein [Microbulbifer sp. A4B17]AWF82163.1 hypothetical protein BTJ40_15735 [Microbulbifer sp. A4B17]
MTIYFANKSLADVNGIKVHARYSFVSIFQNLPNKKGSSDGRLTHKLAPAIKLALEALNDVYTRFTSGSALKDKGSFQQYLAKYFFIDKAEKNDDYFGVLAMIKAIKGGLETNNNVIKVFSDIPLTKKNFVVSGYVTRYHIGKSKSHATACKEATVKDGKLGFVEVEKGDVHMNAYTIDNNSNFLNAVTFLHEASHKYAGTVDHGDKGYTDKEGEYLKKGLTKGSALINAESYARFIMHYYAAENGVDTAI